MTMKTATKTSQSTVTDNSSSKPAKAAKGKPSRPKALGATARRRVEKCIDNFLYFARFRHAVEGAMKAGDGIFWLDNLPEPFRSDYDPETETPIDLNRSIEGSLEAYSIELSQCFNAYCRGAGPFPIFRDERNGKRWVELPPGIFFSPDYTRLAKHPGLEPREWNVSGGNFVVFEAGQAVNSIPAEWLEIGGCGLGIVIHEDGTVTLF